MIPCATVTPPLPSRSPPSFITQHLPTPPSATPTDTPHAFCSSASRRSFGRSAPTARRIGGTARRGGEAQPLLCYAAPQSARTAGWHCAPAHESAAGGWLGARVWGSVLLLAVVILGTCCAVSSPSCAIPLLCPLAGTKHLRRAHVPRLLPPLTPWRLAEPPTTTTPLPSLP